MKASIVVFIPRTSIGGGLSHRERYEETKLKVVSEVSEMAAVGRADAYTSGIEPCSLFF